MDVRAFSSEHLYLFESSEICITCKANFFVRSWGRSRDCFVYKAFEDKRGG